MDKSNDLESLQKQNEAWWTRQTMSYDWRDKVAHQRFSLNWFDEIDARFIAASRLYGHEQRPFDRLIPFGELADRSVLEIGCGMGLHSELLARSGARLTSIDISATSIEATQTRFKLKELQGDIRKCDAVEMNVAPATLDFAWSWGVIHHSAYTARIIRNVSTALKPNGEFRFMVYNLNGMSAYYVMLRRYLSGFWRGRGLDDLLSHYSDGHLARHYTADSLRDLCLAFFEDVEVRVMGQEADAVPLPRFIRGFALRRFTTEQLKRWSERRGGFLFVVARRPR